VPRSGRYTLDQPTRDFAIPRSTRTNAVHERFPRNLPKKPEIVRDHTGKLFEAGIADRVIAQELAGSLRAGGYAERFVGDAIKSDGDKFDRVLAGYPSYFQSAFSNIA